MWISPDCHTTVPVSPAAISSCSLSPPAAPRSDASHRSSSRALTAGQPSDRSGPGQRYTDRGWTPGVQHQQTGTRPGFVLFVFTLCDNADNLRSCCAILQLGSMYSPVKGRDWWEAGWRGAEWDGRFSCAFFSCLPSSSPSPSLLLLSVYHKMCRHPLRFMFENRKN